MYYNIIKHLKMNFNKLRNQLKTAVNQYIQECIDNETITINNENKTLDYEKDSDTIDYLIQDLFNTDNSFADFCETNNYFKVNDSINLIQYCNRWLEINCNGLDYLLEWKRFNDFTYILNNGGYIYVNDNREEFVNLWNELNIDSSVKYLK